MLRSGFSRALFSVRPSRRLNGTLAVPAALIKTLRERTGAPITECKKALQASELDTNAAIEWLRKSGLSVKSKLNARSAGQGMIGAITDASFKSAVIVEVLLFRFFDF